MQDCIMDRQVMSVSIGMSAKMTRVFLDQAPVRERGNCIIGDLEDVNVAPRPVRLFYGVDNGGSRAIGRRGKRLVYGICYAAGMP